MRREFLFLVSVLMLAACPKSQKQPEVVEPVIGWTTVGSLQCYSPPKFADETNEIHRKQLRQTTWAALTEGFSGQVPGAPAMDSARLEALDLVLLGYPARIETFVVDAFEQCSDAAASGNTAAYVRWLDGAARRLSEGDCNRPLIYEIHDQLKVSTGWQMRFHMCKGDKIRIEAAAGDALYTVYDKGKVETNVYHGILGDANNPVLPSAPCQNCLAGALLLRFEEDDGADTWRSFVELPEGTDLAAVYAKKKDAAEQFELEYSAPAHGYISFAVNDDTFYDNVFFENEKRGFTEYLPIDIYPIIGEGEMFLGK